MATQSQTPGQLMLELERQHQKLMYRYQEELAHRHCQDEVYSSRLGLLQQPYPLPAKPPVAPAHDKRILLCPLM